jgi:tRNA modification GTPase
LLREAGAALGRALPLAADAGAFRRHPELFAAEVRRALDVAGEVTGAVSPDEVLGRIFSRFCIGK